MNDVLETSYSRVGSSAVLNTMSFPESRWLSCDFDKGDTSDTTFNYISIRLLAVWKQVDTHVVRNVLASKYYLKRRCHRPHDLENQRRLLQRQ